MNDSIQEYWSFQKRLRTDRCVCGRVAIKESRSLFAVTFCCVLIAPSISAKLTSECSESSRMAVVIFNIYVLNRKCLVILSLWFWLTGFNFFLYDNKLTRLIRYDFFLGAEFFNRLCASISNKNVTTFHRVKKRKNGRREERKNRKTFSQEYENKLISHQLLSPG